MTGGKEEIVQLFYHDLESAAGKYLSTVNEVGDAKGFERLVARTFAEWGVEAMENLIVETLAQVQERREELRQAELRYSGLAEIEEGS